MVNIVLELQVQNTAVGEFKDLIEPPGAERELR